MMRMNLLVLALLSCVVAFPVQAQEQEHVKPVKLLKVSTQGTSLTRQFYGKVVARQTVDLAFQVGGQIVEFPVVEGETIAAGDLIAKLDLEPFELSLGQAKLQQEQADRTLARLNQLSGSTVSQVSIDDATTQAGLTKLAVRNAEFALEHATLHAPFDGLVASRAVANFTTIAAGTPIMRLHDMSELRIEIDVPEVLFQRAGEDPNVTITAKFPASDQEFPLQVREFNAEASSVGQTFRLTFGMTPPEGLRVLPGSSVTVKAILHTGQHGTFVPPTAVATAADGATSVLVFNSTEGDIGTVTREPVEIMATEDGRLQIQTGFDQGVEIVAAGVNDLADGQRVRRFAGFSN